jgi:hypothetical protein
MYLHGTYLCSLFRLYTCDRPLSPKCLYGLKTMWKWPLTCRVSNSRNRYNQSIFLRISSLQNESAMQNLKCSTLLCRQGIMLLDICCLPWIADPLVSNSSCSEVSVFGNHVGWEVAFLDLVLVLEIKASVFNGVWFKERYAHAEQRLRRQSSLPGHQHPASASQPQHLSPVP